MENPELIKAEIERRLATLRAEHPASHRRDGLQRDLTRAQNALRRLIDGYQEQLITLEELRARMPELRRRDATLRAELDALDTELHDAETYLKLTETLDAFRARLSTNAEKLTIEQRQEIVRLVVREVLLGDDDVTVRHSIPVPTGGQPERFATAFTEPSSRRSRTASPARRSSPRSTRSERSAPATVAFSVEPSHSPSGIFTPSVVIPSATIFGAVRAAPSRRASSPPTADRPAGGSSAPRALSRVRSHEHARHRRLRRRPRVGLDLLADRLLRAPVLAGRDAGEHPLQHHPSSWSRSAKCS